ncbi:MAG: DUF3078 domain-containing protein [Bacteroidales bacterium]
MSKPIFISIIILLLIPLFSLSSDAFYFSNNKGNEGISNFAEIDTTIKDKNLQKSSADTLPNLIPGTIKIGGVTILQPADTIPGEDSLSHKGTTQTADKDTIIDTAKDSLSIEGDTLQLKTKLDSAVYFVNQFSQEDTLNILNDTLKTHIQKLIHFIKSKPIDSSINYLNSWTQTDTLKDGFRDTTKIAITDSLYNHLNYLLDYAEEDSVRFYVITRKNDTVPLWLQKKHKKDSSRLVLYDELDHPAGLWVEPLNKNAIKIRFDENTLIEKTGFRRRKEENLPIVLDISKLKKHKPIDMVFPEWRTGGTANLDFNQGYVKNWVKGGENNLNSMLNLKFQVNYKKGKTIWDNDIEYKAGILQSGEKGVRKNEDVFEINSKFGNNARKNWYYSALVNFTTQLFKGYDYPNDSVAVSGVLAPANLVFSVGMDYKPTNDLTILLSPISSKFTMMRDTSRFDQTKYGIDENKKSKKEVGAYVKSTYKFKINEDIDIENRVKLFTNYLYKPQNVDIDWEVTVNMRITEYIKASLNTHLIYDDDIGFPVYEIIDGEEVQVGTTKKMQFKEDISIGVIYRF